jgi:hypothetical protein
MMKTIKIIIKSKQKMLYGVRAVGEECIHTSKVEVLRTPFPVGHRWAFPSVLRVMVV